MDRHTTSRPLRPPCARRLFARAVFVVLLLASQKAFPVDIQLAWQPNHEPDLAGYRIFCRQQGQDYDYDHRAWEGTDSSCTIPGLDTDTTYYFVARAFDRSGNESGDSNEVRYFHEETAANEAAINQGEDTDPVQEGTPDGWPPPDEQDNPPGDSAPETDQDQPEDLAEYGGETDPTAADTDGDGLSDEIELEYGFDPNDPDSRPLFPLMESGDLTVNHAWTYVSFQVPFVDPVVVAKPLSSNGRQPALIRIRGVGPFGFEIRVQEWDYLNETHRDETAGYLVLERGSYALPDGARVEADRFETDRTAAFDQVPFNGAFQDIPVVVTSISTYREATAVTGRAKNVTLHAFSFKLQEQELSDGRHAAEIVSYVAWEPSWGHMAGVVFQVDTTENAVTDAPYQIPFVPLFPATPVFVADLQTADGPNPATLRWQDKDRFGIDVWVQEEKSFDTEMRHTTESVGYLVFWNEP